MEHAPWVLWPLFLAWSFPFWCLVGIEFCFLFWCVSYRRGTFALISLAAVLLGFQFFGDIPVFISMWTHWDTTLEIIAGWLILASPWAFTKWWLFVRDNSYRYEEILAEYLRINSELPKDVNTFTVEQKVAWQEYFNAHSYQDDAYEYTRVEFYPTASAHKADIMTWMMFWPWSFLWTVLNDPIRKLFKNLYRMMVGWLDKITKVYWGDKLGHMPTAKELEDHRIQKRKEQEAQWAKDREENEPRGRVMR